MFYLLSSWQGSLAVFCAFYSNNTIYVYLFDGVKFVFSSDFTSLHHGYDSKNNISPSFSKKAQNIGQSWYLQRYVNKKSVPESLSISSKKKNHSRISGKITHFMLVDLDNFSYHSKTLKTRVLITYYLLQGDKYKYSTD